MGSFNSAYSLYNNYYEVIDKCLDTDRFEKDLHIKKGDTSILKSKEHQKLVEEGKKEVN